MRYRCAALHAPPGPAACPTRARHRQRSLPDCAAATDRPTRLQALASLQVVYDSEQVSSPQKLVQALHKGGLEGSLRRTGLAAGGKLATLRVSGMTCTACSTSVEAALLGVPGVHSAAVSVMLQVTNLIVNLMQHETV